MRALLLALISIFILSSERAFGQDFSGGLEHTPDSTENVPEEEDYRLKDHIRLGGNLGAQFGTVTFINVSPMIGYQFNKRWMVGTRGTYQYFRIRQFTQISGHLFGGSTFARAFVLDNLFVHGEYEVLNGFFDNSGRRTNIPFLYAGLGFIQPINDKVGFSVTALYELLRRQYSPTGLPSIRAGIVVGL